MIRNAIEFVHYLLQDKVKQAAFLVDGTCGNGYDTQYLAEKAQSTANILAFDIQQLAVDRTQERLQKADIRAKVQIIKDSHENIDKYLTAVDVALFNLGYLPSGDHQLTTTAQSTVHALQRLLPLLSEGGMVACVAYPGHPAGFIEMEALEKFCSQLSQQQYHVGCFKLLNQVHQPSALYLIEKIRSEAREGIAPRKDQGDC